MKYMKLIVPAIFVALWPFFAFASDDEISLFSSSGDAVAYIAVADELTIYFWEGKPVAYVHQDDDQLHIYGFNGKHLGWFVGGSIYTHSGTAACGTEDVMQTKFEPFKALKQFKPFKAFKEFAPFRPSLQNKFSEIPCQFLLGSGAAN